MKNEIPASVIYDHFLEASHEEEVEFSAGKRRVRRYAAELREELYLPTLANIRQYSEVTELPKGWRRY